MRKGFAGAPVVTAIVGSMSPTVPGAGATFSIALATGWTFTATPFVVVVDRGGATEEKILCSAIAGTTVTVGQRGYDSTTGQSHNPGAEILPVLDSVVVDEANLAAENYPALFWMGGI
jgi:hypothetical protein